MNKKGFTLVEMMAAVIIIGIIELEQAACVYIDLNEYSQVKASCFPSGTCNVKVKTLVEGGLIDENLINPQTDAKVNQNLTIQVKWDASKNKTCTLQ